MNTQETLRDLHRRAGEWLDAKAHVNLGTTLEATSDGIAALFDMITSGAITPYIGARYPVKDAAQAHRDLEARKTVGSSVLVV